MLFLGGGRVCLAGGRSLRMVGRLGPRRECGQLKVLITWLGVSLGRFSVVGVGRRWN